MPASADCAIITTMKDLPLKVHSTRKPRAIHHISNLRMLNSWHQLTNLYFLHLAYLSSKLPALINSLFNANHSPYYTFNLIAWKLSLYSMIDIFRVRTTASNANFALSSFALTCFAAKVHNYYTHRLSFFLIAFYFFHYSFYAIFSFFRFHINQRQNTFRQYDPP